MSVGEVAHGWMTFQIYACAWLLYYQEEHEIVREELTQIQGGNFEDNNR